MAWLDISTIARSSRARSVGAALGVGTNRTAARDSNSGASTASDSIEARLLNICNAVLAPRHITPGDNLFEIGASSLKLIEIHEQVDREYPNIVDLTELFDYPTVAQLAAHLSVKLGPAG